MNTVSQTEFFPLCREILEENLRPIHYRELTKMALELAEVPISSIDFQRQAEDVREKLPIHSRYGVNYIGEPYCLMILAGWFELHQPALLNTEPPMVIPGSVSSGITGAYESVKRVPHLLKKSEFASDDTRHRVAAKGFVIEAHVRDWFRVNWPGYIFPADNSGQWHRPCDHDFKISTPGYDFNVDVMGPKLNGTYSRPPSKKSTDFHLLCRASDDGQDVFWEGFITGHRYRQSGAPILPEVSRSTRQMIVWLNCLSVDIDYLALREMLFAAPRH